MAEPPFDQNVVPFPARRWTGGAGLPARDPRPVRRAERRATVLFAELRGFRAVADERGRPQTELAIGKTVDRVLEGLMEFGAFDVTLDGPPMQPVVSATFEGRNHAFRALRAADSIRSAVGEAGSLAPPGRKLQACVGLNTGDIVEMAMGEETPVAWGEVGVLRTLAARLQEFAGPGQIFLSQRTSDEVEGLVTVRPVGEVRVNADGESRQAFCLVSLAPPPTSGA